LVTETNLEEVTDTQPVDAVVDPEPAAPTFRQALSDGVNSLATAMTNLMAADNRAVNAVEDRAAAQRQVEAADAAMVSADAAVVESVVGAVEAHDGVIEVLQASRVQLLAR
jgi:hypothetical protein